MTLVSTWQLSTGFRFSQVLSVRAGHTHTHNLAGLQDRSRLPGEGHLEAFHRHDFYHGIIAIDTGNVFCELHDTGNERAASLHRMFRCPRCLVWALCPYLLQSMGQDIGGIPVLRGVWAVSATDLLQAGQLQGVHIWGVVPGEVPVPQ